ncbi:hypothetical protein M404DRAFT_31015 [Pisolithus tinctorius Marx 270]|uniref:Reverse transcriptase Ty1/copia-type domain-containing protein n=1 Tax=Pisolithus tinctorius Marx 270 TaxID=870435 RepID=A0A0C3NCP2_PISTI|nr:hypothetical protein M404DRAFT_31015 [Pisolithus tinctorius Marx 270]
MVERPTEATSGIPRLIPDPLRDNFETPPPQPRRSTRQHFKSDYMRRLRAGEGTRDGRIPLDFVKELQEKLAADEDDTNIMYAMVAGMAEAEGLDPSTVCEAKSQADWPKWQNAINAELNSLEEVHTWDVIECPKGANVVGCKWVFKIKHNAAGEIEKYKACLVTKGYSQIQGIDYDETYAPIARLTSLCTILAVAARNDWDIDVFDFHSAFLNGKLRDGEDIYMELPEGYAVGRNFSCPVGKLNIALYGSKQGALQWYQKLCATLAGLGLTRAHADWGVFYGRIGSEILILASHVDDCTVTGSSPSLIRSFKQEIGTRFKISDLGPISWLLGMKVTWNREARTISLSQQSYIEAILTKYNLTDCKPAAIPMDPGIKLSRGEIPQPAEEAAHMKNVPYHAAVGSLMHLTIGTRPDIAFAVSTVMQFNNAPNMTHWEAVKRIYRYISGTKALALMFGNSERGLEGYTDADGASQEHQRAISRYAYLLDGGAISWASQKQELVTLSTAEVEYIAATHAAKEGLRLR